MVTMDRKPRQGYETKEEHMELGSPGRIRTSDQTKVPFSESTGSTRHLAPHDHHRHTMLAAALTFARWHLALIKGQEPLAEHVGDHASNLHPGALEVHVQPEDLGDRASEPCPALPCLDVEAGRTSSL